MALDDIGKESADDPMSPHNVAPLVAYLAVRARRRPHHRAGVPDHRASDLELWTGWHSVAHVENDTAWNMVDIE